MYSPWRTWGRDYGKHLKLSDNTYAGYWRILIHTRCVDLMKSPHLPSTTALSYSWPTTGSPIFNPYVPLLSFVHIFLCDILSSFSILSSIIFLSVITIFLLYSFIRFHSLCTASSNWILFFFFGHLPAFSAFFLSALVSLILFLSSLQ